jgi:hypothetical protein
MALRGNDQFYFILTSDGSFDMYPENKTSSFQISLRKPLDFGEDDWEVGLQSVNYPYSWVNVGPAAGVSMKYIVDRYVGVEEVKFPNWQCQTVKEIEKFITEKIRMNYIQRGENDTKKMRKLELITDELGRIKIGCNEPDFDLGLSDNLLRVLGLLGHPEMEILRMDSFEKRQKQREIIEFFWGKEYDTQISVMAKSIPEWKDLMRFCFIVHESINWGDIDKNAKAKWENIDITAKELVEVERLVEGSKKYSENIAHNPLNVISPEVLKLLALLMIRMKLYINEKKPPKIIKGVLPAVLNPVERMYIYLNIIKPIDMNDNPMKLLKLVNTEGEPFKTTQAEFSNLTYVPVEKGSHNMLQVYIKNDRGMFVPFMSGTVVLTLHFRKTQNSSRRRTGYF